MDNITLRFITWQRLVIQTQELALKVQATGINPDDLALLPIDQLTGTLSFLKRKRDEQEAG